MSAKGREFSEVTESAMPAMLLLGEYPKAVSSGYKAVTNRFMGKRTFMGYKPSTDISTTCHEFH